MNEVLRDNPGIAHEVMGAVSARLQAQLGADATAAVTEIEAMKSELIAPQASSLSDAESERIKQLATTARQATEEELEACERVTIAETLGGHEDDDEFWAGNTVNADHELQASEPTPTPTIDPLGPKELSPKSTAWFANQDLMRERRQREARRAETLRLFTNPMHYRRRRLGP